MQTASRTNRHNIKSGLCHVKHGTTGTVMSVASIRKAALDSFSHGQGVAEFVALVTSQ